jgi:hypothetical protein
LRNSNAGKGCEHYSQPFSFPVKAPWSLTHILVRHIVCGVGFVGPV